MLAPGASLAFDFPSSSVTWSGDPQPQRPPQYRSPANRASWSFTHCIGPKETIQAGFPVCLSRITPNNPSLGLCRTSHSENLRRVRCILENRFIRALDGSCLSLKLLESTDK